MIAEVSFSGTTFNELPYKFEAGTPNITSVIAFGETLKLLEELGMKNIHAWEKTLLEQTEAALRKIEGIKIYGESNNKAGVISFNHSSIHPYDLGMMLDKLGIAIRTGHHCADPVMEHFSIPGTVRASLGMYTSEEDIHLFIRGLEKVIRLF